MIYLVKPDKLEQSNEYLLMGEHRVIEHWLIHYSGAVMGGGPLKGLLWPELAPSIQDNPEWVICTETMPLARLIVALRGETKSE